MKLEYDYHSACSYSTANLSGAVTVADIVAAVGITVTIDGVVSRNEVEVVVR